MILLCGDSVEKLKRFLPNSVDAVVTDPPYGLSFMNKNWDYDVPTKELWREVLRVLKPGGHLLSFGGTRTYHRLVVAIEDAGFEIRDQVQWIYGSGFPKSLDVSKAIDKAAGAEREVIGKDPNYHSEGKRTGTHGFAGDRGNENYQFASEPGMLTAPATDDAKQWQGWGTALKPANEPICLARKPLEKGLTVAQNVLKWGTGAINVDETRVAFQSEKDLKSATFGSQPKITSKGVGGEGGTFQGYSQGVNAKDIEANPKGRWPANVLFDEQAAEALDEQSGTLKSGEVKAYKRKSDDYYSGAFPDNINSAPANSGGASRFFYVPKASKRERNAGLEGMPAIDKKPFEGGMKSLSDPRMEGEQQRLPQQNFHPTVKPIKLMEYLIKLVTPPKGTVLDPFMGSGSTGVAAQRLGLQFIGIELSPEYFEIAKRRIEGAPKSEQLELEGA